MPCSTRIPDRAEVNDNTPLRLKVAAATAFPSVRTHNGGPDGWSVIHGSYGRGRWIISG